MAKELSAVTLSGSSVLPSIVGTETSMLTVSSTKTKQPSKRKQKLNPDFEIHGKRITRVLVDMKEKVKFVLTLPYVLTHCGRDLEELLGTDELNKVFELVEPYQQIKEDPLAILRVSSTTSVRHLLERYISPSPPAGKLENSDLALAISMLRRNPAVFEFISQYNGMISLPGQTFLEKLEELIHYIGERVRMTPRRVHAKDVDLYKKFRKNQWAREELLVSSQELESQISDNLNNITSMDSRIQALIEQRVKVEAFARQSVKTYQEEAEKKMQWDWKVSEARQEKMEENAAQIEREADERMKQFEDESKKLRVARFKLESQLIALLDKYDEDIAERHDTQTALEAEFASEMEELNAFQEKYDQQEIEYTDLMQEKKSYEETVRLEKLYLIQCKIAARKIQKYFRAYLDTCRARGKRFGKGRKGKKKK